MTRCFRLRSGVEQVDQVKREGDGERCQAKETAGAKAARQEKPGYFTFGRDNESDSLRSQCPSLHPGAPSNRLRLHGAAAAAPEAREFWPDID